MEQDAEPAVKDAALIAAAQKVEHYEIAAYGCVCTYAEMLGYEQVHELLGQNLDEEETTDQRLTALAESVINLEAEEAVVLRGDASGRRPATEALAYARAPRDVDHHPGLPAGQGDSAPGPAGWSATTPRPSTSPHQSPIGPSPSRNPRYVAHRKAEQPVAEQIHQHRDSGVSQPAQDPSPDRPGARRRPETPPRAGSKSRRARRSPVARCRGGQAARASKERGSPVRLMKPTPQSNAEWAAPRAPAGSRLPTA